MINFGACHPSNAVDKVVQSSEVGSHGRHRSLPTPARRVIFPSLHHVPSPSLSSDPRPSPKPREANDSFDWERRGGNSFDLTPSPTNVATNVQYSSLKPVLIRASSLDGILIPLPKLSLREDSKPGDLTLPKLLNQRLEAQYPIHTKRSQTAPTGKSRTLPQQSLESRSQLTKTFKSPFLGETVRHRTYYPAASIPTTVDEKKTPSLSKPLSSILRKKLPSSPVSQQSSPSRREGAPCTSPLSPKEGIPKSSSQPSHVTHSSCLPQSVPTLASPASLKSLHSLSHRSESDKHEALGESEYGIAHLSTSPKPLPRKECKMRRNKSDTVVAKNEEEHSRPRRDSTSSSVHEGHVSRHQSLECLANKRISFDPRISVVEFGTTDYEKKGGEKWWTEDELSQFKEEAIHRIRLRSTTVIPTGTGRALTVMPTEDRGKNVEGKKSPANSESNGKSQGSVLFNHPALGCDDDEYDDSLGISGGDESLQEAVTEIRNILVVDPHEIFLSEYFHSNKHHVHFMAHKKCFPSNKLCSQSL
ncbi:hypothetical protein ACHAWF_014739 [Thalassiosira exigua]